MGMIGLRVWGSFNSRINEVISAEKSGHAVAVDDAIKELEKLRESAAEQDRDLRAGGDAPEDNFAEADRRGLLSTPGQEGGK